VGENRRDARYPARIVARVIRRNQTIEFLTNDVSFRGVFIRTDAPPSLRQLVRVELVLPSGLVVSGHAMVVHLATREPTGGGPPTEGKEPIPGMGLQFWGPLMHMKEWEQFIHHLKHRHHAGTATARRTDKIRRASERFKVSIEVVFDGKTSMTRDISENGMAIRSDAEMPIGTRVSLEMRAGMELVVFDVVVRRPIRDPEFRGLGVEFVNIDAKKRDALLAFVRKNTPSEERIFIQPRDPKLH
jgi:hypothetical protein